MKKPLRFLVSAALVVAGCQRPTDATSSSSGKSPNSGTFLAARPLGVSCLKPGETVAPGPTVIVSDNTGRPLPNVPVTFHVGSGGGAIADTLAVTDNAGLASPGWWRLGTSPGANTVVARQGRGTVVFQVLSTRNKLVARFALRSIGGRPLPLTYSGGGNSWTITGGHYFLGDDGAYLFGYEVNNEDPAVPNTFCSTARYVVDPLDPRTMRFYLAPGSYPASTFYQQRDGLFSTALLRGDSLFAKYEDFLDFEDEVYTSVLGLVSLSAPSSPR